MPRNSQGVFVGIKINEEIAQACKMVRDHTFEGELFIEEFPSRHRQEVLRLITNYGNRATAIDPQHRLIKVEETPKGHRVTTTENQLADKLAKKIKDVFSHAAEPAEVDRFRVVFNGT